MNLRSVPRPRTLLRVAGVLSTSIPSSNPVMNYGQSEKGVPHLRYSAETNSLPWFVDIYSSRYFYVCVGTKTGQILKAIPSLVGYLAQNLGVRLGDEG